MSFFVIVSLLIVAWSSRHDVNSVKPGWMGGITKNNRHYTDAIRFSSAAISDTNNPLSKEDITEKDSKGIKSAAYITQAKAHEGMHALEMEANPESKATQNLVEAISKYDLASKSKPENPIPYLGIGHNHWLLGGNTSINDHESARFYGEKALLVIGNTLKNKEIPEVSADNLKVHSFIIQAKALVGKYSILKDVGYLSEAVPNYLAALYLKDDNPQAHSVVAKAYFGLKVGVTL